MTTVNWWFKKKKRYYLGRKVEVFRQHGGDARDLLLATKERGVGGGLKVQCHFAVDPGHDLHQLKLPLVLLKHLTEGLQEPRAIAFVSPRIVACNTNRETFTQLISISRSVNIRSVLR